MLNWQNFNWKKIALIIGFIAICIALGFLIYYLFFQSIVAPKKTAEQPATTEQLPVAITGKQPGLVAPTGKESIKPETGPTSITKIEPTAGKKVDQVAAGGVTAVKTLSYETASNIALSADGEKAISYNPNSGKFYTIDADGNQAPLTDKIYKNVKNIAWNGQKQKAVLEFPDGTNILYDFAADKQISLPKDWADFSFNGGGGQIAFKDMNANPDYRFLAIANADGSGQKYITPLGDEADNFKVDWSPNGKMIAQYKIAGTASTSKLFLMGQYDEKFKSITLNGGGAETKWTPDGNKLIYSAHNTTSDFKPELYIVDASGNNIGYNNNSLKLNTWADKCAFAGTETMYCAVPKELPYGANLTPAIADNIPDYIYKVDLTTGTKSFVAEPEIEYTIDQLQVDAGEANLYFTDKATKTLHAIKLK